MNRIIPIIVRGVIVGYARSLADADEIERKIAERARGRDVHRFVPAGTQYPAMLYCDRCGASETEHVERSR